MLASHFHLTPSISNLFNISSNMEQKLAYTSIAKPNGTIFCEYSPFKGNYSTIAMMVLPKITKDGNQSIDDLE
jgi:hypothetical protein